MDNMDLNYEDAINKLNGIIEDLEKDNCSLDESVEKFKKGIKLYNHCNSLLSKVEGEIKLLLKDDSEQIKEVEFPLESSNEVL